ncbi:TAL effector repeat-containing protein, partial [Mycetohabitans sp. B7]
MHQEDKRSANGLNLSALERIKIKKHYGGGATLAFISNQHDELAQVLSRADILKIASYDCAAQALQAVLDCGLTLGKRGFSR